MNFLEALNMMLTGTKVRRKQWEDSRVHIAIVNEKLSIYHPDKNNFGPLIVSTGDITAEDWIVCRQEMKQ